MVCLCAVPGCGNETGCSNNIRMHGFPFHNSKLVQQWTQAICRVNWCPTRNSKICGDHFKPDDYISIYSNRLKPYAIPSVSLPVLVESYHKEENNFLLNDQTNKTINKKVGPNIFASEDRKHSIPMPVHMDFRKRPRVATITEILASRQQPGEQQIDIETELPISTIFNVTKSKNCVNLVPSIQSTSNSSSSSGGEYNISSSKTISKIIDIKNDEDLELLTVKLTNISIEKNPKMYVGINKVWYENGFIELLSQKSNVPKRDLHLTLMKLRLNDSFERLGHMYGISESMSNMIFNNSIIYLSDFLKEVIHWPGNDNVFKLLPIPFRCKYNNVKSIINILEIEISKPMNQQQHLLTWSEEKKCNLLKYLIASTPDGFINFVSKGFGGSLSDTKILAQSLHFIDLLPFGCTILAEKRFENILSVIKCKNCELMILPSVSMGTNSTIKQTLFIKSIMSVRIYFDRVLKQMREYEILKKHSVVDTSLIPNFDAVVVTIAALVNLQSTLVTD